MPAGLDPQHAPSIRRLCICADDFGLEEGVDSGIVSLAANGRLNAVSCLSTGPTFDQHAAQIRDLDVDTGLHLNFTESLGQSGIYFPIGKLIAMAYTHRLPVGRVNAQIERQLDRFETVMGRAPHFIDGHLHIHQLPQIRDTLVRQVANRYGKGSLPWMRDTRPPAMDIDLPFAQRLKAILIGAFGASGLRQLASLHGIRMNEGGFVGVYDFARPHPPYISMLNAWLDSVRDAALLMVHPARHVRPDNVIGNDRVEEYLVLGSAALMHALDSKQIKLARLSQLSSLP